MCVASVDTWFPRRSRGVSGCCQTGASGQTHPRHWTAYQPFLRRTGPPYPLGACADMLRVLSLGAQVTLPFLRVWEFQIATPIISNCTHTRKKGTIRGIWRLKFLMTDALWDQGSKRPVGPDFCDSGPSIYHKQGPDGLAP